MNQSISDLVLDLARDDTNRDDKQELPNIISYIESPWGLNLPLFPVQKFILKLYYGLELDSTVKNIQIYDKFREILQWELTEKEYLNFLWNEGRINIKEPDHIRNELVLVIGRRGTKTAMSSFISSYETYKLLMLDNPHKYYGIPEYNRIGVISVATDKDQASLLFSEVSGHIESCEIFRPYVESETRSMIRMWSPFHLRKYKERAKPKIYVTFKACIAKGLRGTGNIVVVLDEFAHFTDQGQTSSADIYKAVTPSTTTFTPKDPNNLQKKLKESSDGRVISISSPLSDSGKFYELYETAMSNNIASNNMLCIQAPSWEVNIGLATETLKQEYYKNPEDFMVEYGAQFSGTSSKFIERKEDLKACIYLDLKPKVRSYVRKPYYMGIDIGLVEDGTTFCITHPEDDYIELDYIEAWYARQGKWASLDRLEFDSIIDHIAELAKEFGVIEGIFDQWHGIAIEQGLRKKGLNQFHGEHFSDDLNSRIYRNFLMLMYAKRLHLYNFPRPVDASSEFFCDYLKEMLDLRKERRSKNIISVFAPKIAGKHDDYSDALTRSIWLSSSLLRGDSDKNRQVLKRAISPRNTSGTGMKRQQFIQRVMHGESPRNMNSNMIRYRQALRNMRG